MKHLVVVEIEVSPHPGSDIPDAAQRRTSIEAIRNALVKACQNGFDHERSHEVSLFPRRIGRPDEFMTNLINLIGLHIISQENDIDALRDELAEYDKKVP